MIMKRMFLVASLSLVGIGSFCDDGTSTIVSRPFERVQEEHIASNKAMLKKDALYTKATRIGAKSLAVLAGAYIVWSYVSPWVYPAAPNVVATPGALPANLTERLVQLEQTVAPSLLSWQWFKNNASYITNSLVTMGTVTVAGNAVGDFNRAVFHPDSIEWFVQNKTTLADLAPYQIDLRYSSMMDLQMYAMALKKQDLIKKSTIEELKDHLGALDSMQGMSEENRAMIRYLITTSCNSMVAGIELILGFMAFKQENASGAVVDEIETNIRYLRNCSNNFCDKLEVLLADCTIEEKKKKSDSIDALNALKGELRRLINRFSVIEREQEL